MVSDELGMISQEVDGRAGEKERGGTRITYANVRRHEFTNVEGLDKRTHAVKESQDDAGYQAITALQPLTM